MENNNEQQGVNIIAIIIVGALIFGAFIVFMNWPRPTPPAPVQDEQPINIDITTPAPEPQEPDVEPIPEPITN